MDLTDKQLKTIEKSTKKSDNKPETQSATQMAVEEMSNDKYFDGSPE